ncbi:CHASE2 domain-containing protein [Novilysobacter antarcticus]|uniref:CHASE2 domain-containing protein n=1 Tax=Novilysobacter antarcticus TaxID=2862543 RepID=UPI001C992FF1|nr:CHASE2 domain-containing protein [Lysobacter antarcticus]
MATLGVRAMDAWTVVLRGYRRPLAWLTLQLRFAFFPLLAAAAIGWLAWDWTHERSLDAAEDAIFDQVLRWRPIEPTPSGRVVVVEIDDCSIEYFRSVGEGGWPWSRARHADLIDGLDRAGVRGIGFDVLFADRSAQDPQGDELLEEMAKAGDGRFLFAASRLHRDFDARALLTADLAPAAYPRTRGAATPGPTVALMLPYGQAMARHSALVNVARAEDGVVRDVLLYLDAGDWNIPALPMRLAALADDAPATVRHPPSPLLRVNWRARSQLPYASAADVIEQRPICHTEAHPMPSLTDTVALVGFTAAGINDIKPTPVNRAMPGVEVLAEATEALVAGSAIRMPPGWVKYVLAALATLLTTLVFWRGQPHKDVDSVFVAINALLLLIAFAGLTLFGFFLDIFACVGFISLCFGACRMYSGVQRGRADGNSDYTVEHDPAAEPWTAVVRLRLLPDATLSARTYKVRRREYRRVLRRYVYAEDGIVMIDGVVERKHVMTAMLDDIVVLLWNGNSEAALRERVRNDLDALQAELVRYPGAPAASAQLAIAFAISKTGGDNPDQRRLKLRGLLGQDFNQRPERPLADAITLTHTGPTPDGEIA